MSGVTIFFALLSVLVAVTYVATAPSELYSDKYDFVDIDEILKNDRIRKQYSKCYLSTGPCATPDATFFKDIFPEALATRCKKCTDKQKVIFEKIVVYYTENNPEEWNKILTQTIQGRRA